MTGAKVPLKEEIINLPTTGLLETSPWGSALAGLSGAVPEDEEILLQQPYIKQVVSKTDILTKHPRQMKISATTCRIIVSSPPTVICFAVLTVISQEKHWQISAQPAFLSTVPVHTKPYSRTLRYHENALLNGKSLAGSH